MKARFELGPPDTRTNGPEDRRHDHHQGSGNFAFQRVFYRGRHSTDRFSPTSARRSSIRFLAILQFSIRP
jgi:hypothetical protein